MHDPDDFDSSGFADMLADATWLIFFLILALLLLSPFLL